MLIIAIILFGMLAGALAQIILGRGTEGIDWTLAFVAGLVGSFVGGLLISLLAGDGLELRPSGIIGSVVGALIVTFAWQWWRGRAKTSR
ncbi:GlsB/YeaQ/YmgE family stress response membrane protein [Mumia zhuanghuii]|uniref:GlsB/YeaQ/YmgE family stress response membrane protein n=1 Tax=Mumia zhuanghuii TaxID=2585211 RepID=A0A5C4MLC0_9ACTN|nr:GlsB/YeaQ/YmgE family stress response membrane protein [Mumia zhuanghuii]TNC31748.1 GlsB/YeaQ/YmgE family stress response membrane protein [Mumia zhuanghuii]TNC46535.1 GlsB/YeaQ/YmgE family stress response membrane protein [Mumia zhuanghuii]